MSTRLIIEGNSVYEIDEECLACSREPEKTGKKAEKSGLIRVYDGKEEGKDRKADMA